MSPQQQAELELRLEVSSQVSLEARLASGRGGAIAVLCHPHPQFGGDMHNNVVQAARAALQRSGLGTLRFNFRGVGRSSGSYGGGVDEKQDVVAACAEARTRSGERKPHLLGYSFGAWVALQAVCDGLEACSLTLIAPPVDVLDFAGVSLPEVPSLVVVGEADAFCATESLARWLRGQCHPAELEMVGGADHFFGGQEANLVGIVERFYAAVS